MAYSEAILRRAEARLEEERRRHDAEAERRRELIYTSQPRLREIDLALRQTAAKVMAACYRDAQDPAEAIERLHAENRALQEERSWILESNDLDPDDLDPQPLCPDCGGRGYLGAVMCSCLKELCRQEQKKELTMLPAGGKDCFENFRIDCYPDTYDPVLHCSPRTLMESIRNSARHYARTFSPESGSILMLGATGLGKTLLSACIARKVAESGFGVTYETANRVFSDFEAEKFGKAEGAGLTKRYLDCDLLILDDLGTEMTTQFTVSALYQLVNSRMMMHRPTIISTNLPAAELAVRYGAQIESRLLGTYELYQFRGNDVRRMQT